MRFIAYIAVIFHIVLVAGAAFGWFDDFFHGTHYTANHGLDLKALYQAGEDLAKGDPIYKIPPYEEGYTPYRYLPIGAAIGIGLSRLSFEHAYIVWFILLEVFMLISLVHLRSYLISDEDFYIALSMYLFFTPFYVELFMGQYSLIQATFILLMLTQLYSNRPGTGYSYWIASVLWKLNTFLALPVLIKYGKWKPVLWAVGLTLLSLIIYGIIFGKNVFYFFGINFRAPAIYQEGNLGLRMLWDSIILHVFGLGHPAEGGGTYVLSTGGKILSMLLPIGVLIACFHALFKARKGKFIDLICLWIAAYFLLYTDIWEHHYIMLLPILVVQYSRKHWPLILICYLFVAVPTTFAFSGNIPLIYIPGNENDASLWSILLHHALKPIPTLIFFIALWRHIITWRPEWNDSESRTDWPEYPLRNYK